MGLFRLDFISEEDKERVHQAAVDSPHATRARPCYRPPVVGQLLRLDEAVRVRSFPLSDNKRETPFS